MDNLTIFKRIWLRPRQVMGYWLDSKDAKTDNETFVFTLAALGGFVHAVDRAMGKSLGDEIPLLAVLGMCLVISFFMGPIGLLINGALYSWVGKKMTGKPKDPYYVRAALAFGSIPKTANILTLGLLISVLGQEAFTTETPRLDSSDSLLLITMAIVAVAAIFEFWSVFTTSHALGETFEVSGWKGFAIFMMPYLFLVAVVLLVVFLSSNSPTATVGNLVRSVVR